MKRIIMKFFMNLLIICSQERLERAWICQTPLQTSLPKTFQSDSGLNIRTKKGHQQAKGRVSGYLSGFVFDIIPFKYRIDFEMVVK